MKKKTEGSETWGKKGWQRLPALRGSAPRAGSVWFDVMEADRQACVTEDNLP